MTPRKKLSVTPLGSRLRNAADGRSKREGSFTLIHRCRWVVAAAISLMLLPFAACKGSASTAASCIAGRADQPSLTASPALVRLPSLDGTTLAYLDFVNDAKFRRGHTYVVAPGALITVSGWAVDRTNRSAASAVMAQVDQNSFRIADYCLARPDVSLHFSEPSYLESGFAIRIPTDMYKPGSEHLVRLLVVNAKKTGVWFTDFTFSFVIAAQQTP